MIQGEASSSSGSSSAKAKQPPSTPSPGLNAEAGPSTISSRRLSNPTPVPDSSPFDASEISTIQKHLDKRRKSIHLPLKKKLSVVHADADKREAAAWHEQMNDVDSADEAEGSVRGGRSVTFDLEELKRTMPDAVRMLQGGEDWKGVDLDDGLERGYAWDVMFENQRGIHFLGKAYFTSKSLLPTDPSQYTVPGRPIPTATTLSISTVDPKSGPDRSQHLVETLRSHTKPRQPETRARGEGFGGSINLSAEHRSIKTAYSLVTFQCPGPQWEWVTPWMINMKVGTDEGGWRYNAWFKKKGWRNHAGRAGWWGWVRRREWVRLRMVVPVEYDDDEGAVVDENGEGERHMHGKKRKSLKEIVMETDEEERAGRVLHAMSSISLDREKLIWWDDGLELSEDDSCLHSAIQAVLEDPDNIKLLRRAFTHRLNFSTFLSLLEDHRYSVASSVPTSPISPSSPPPADP